MCVQLFNSGFLVTVTDSQDFKHAYAYNSTTTEHYRCSYVHLKTGTILAHDALHRKNLESRSNHIPCITVTTDLGTGTPWAVDKHAVIFHYFAKNPGDSYKTKYITVKFM